MFEFSDVFESEFTTRVFLILSILCAALMAAAAIMTGEPTAARPLRRMRGPAARLTAVIGVLATVVGLAWATSRDATSPKASLHEPHQPIDPRTLQQHAISNLL